jgi:hypothetical protein
MTAEWKNKLHRRRPEIGQKCRRSWHTDRDSSRVVEWRRWIAVFWVVMPHHFQFQGTYISKIESVSSSKTLATSYMITPRHNPEDENPSLQGLENIKNITQTL